MDITPISMTALSRRIKAAGIKDEWEFLLRLAGGDHSAAFMLRRCILWSNNAKVKKANGWFWRRDSDWRSADGLNRYKLLQARDALTKRGLLNTCIQRILLQTDLLLGKKMTHYQINPVIFWASVESTIEEMTGTVPTTPENENPESTESKNTPVLRESECSPSSDAPVQGDQIEVSKVAIYGCEPSSDTGVEGEQTQISLDKSPVNDKSPEDLNLSIKSDAPRQIDLIDTYSVEFKECEYRVPIEGLIAALGIEESRRVMEQCKHCEKHQTEGVGWGFVKNALENAVQSREQKRVPTITAIEQTPPPTPSPKITTIRSWARECFNDVPERFAAELAAMT